MVVTWDRHPNETLRPERVPPLLSTPERRVELIIERGPDVLVTLPFDKEMSSWPPERFVTEALVTGLGARAVFIGRGWRFGHKAAGDVDLLTRLGAEHGFGVEALELEQAEGGPVSSTRVREAVRSGDVPLARALLARPFDVDGVVQHGDDRGQALGFPTANIAIDPLLVNPPRGVYAGRARVGDLWYRAAINVGVNPTFGGDPATTPLRIEAYLLDFSGDLYGRTLRVEFWERLRDEQRFESAEALIVQMRRDVQETERIVDARA